MVSLYYNIAILESINLIYLSRETQRREWLWFSLELCFEPCDMILVYVSIAELDDELARFGVGDVRDHVREEGVGGDVEGDTKTEVG